VISVTGPGLASSLGRCAAAGAAGISVFGAASVFMGGFFEVLEWLHMVFAACDNGVSAYEKPPPNGHAAVIRGVQHAFFFSPTSSFPSC
jgi:hypothetical protein